jgi:hypothetical protein
MAYTIVGASPLVMIHHRFYSHFHGTKAAEVRSLHVILRIGTTLSLFVKMSLAYVFSLAYVQVQ